MATTTVNVSFPKRFLARLDRVARQEARSRSELLRQATRVYIERRQQWNRLLSFWRSEARRAGLKPADVPRLIAEYRREQRAS